MKLIAGLLVPVALFAADAARVGRVETGLRYPVVVSGEAEKKFALADRMREAKVTGLSVAVVDGGKLDWAKGYGSRGADGPVTVDTMFQAASISKPVAAMVAMKLVEMGRLSLDEDVNVKLKSWKVPASAAAEGEPVTLRRLLSHTAGLTVHGFGGYEAGKPFPTLVQLLDGVKPANSAAVRIDLRPGKQWRYSGGGYEVMQLLVEDVTGEPFAALAERLVLKPLGMKHSTYAQPLPAALLKRAAAGHNREGVPIPGLRNTYPEQTAAGLWTTPSDLVKVILEIQKPGRVLKPETVDTMLTLVLGNYGLGFSLELTEQGWAFSHGGSNEGFKCMLFGYRKSGKGAVIMSNMDRGPVVTEQLLRAISAEYGWASFQPRTKTLFAMTPEALGRYAGKYKTQGGEMEVTVQGGGLLMKAPFIPLPVKMEPEGEGKFFSRTGEAPDVTIAARADGKLEIRGGRVVGVKE